MMALDCSPSNTLRDKLDNLSVGSSSQTLPDDAHVKRLLPGSNLFLSQSLAEAGAESQELQMLSSSLERAEETGQSLIQGHPEPSILATSMGKHHDGRLIPSSSTISLLSLNNVSGTPTFTSHLEAQNANTKVTLSHGSSEIVSPHTNPRSRNSITHLSHQRLQPYHKLSSPVSAMSDFTLISSPKSIPWTKNQIMTPDSPNLHPTSIGESPSRLWLSSETPPKSMINPMSKSRSLFLALGGLGLGQYQSFFHEKQGYPQAVDKAKGSDSPVLNPVQTPLEDLPMTPLLLSSEGSYRKAANEQKSFGDRQMDYFFGAADPILTHDEKEQLHCDDDDQNMN